MRVIQQLRAASLGAVSVAAVTCSGAVMAQDGDAGTGGLDQIVVTAQKRTENLQEVPISVSAINAEAIDRANAVDLAGIGKLVPGVHIGSFGNQQFSGTFNIRGVGVVEPDAFAGNSVSIVSDGVPQFFNYGSVVDIFDVERIEVLKGPQGTLFGANTTGGVINIVSRQPDDEFGGYVTGSIGTLEEQHMRFSLGGALNLPLAEGLALRLAANHYDRDGWIHNVENPDDNLGQQSRNLFRGTLRYESGDVTATLLGEIATVRAGGNYIAQGTAPGEFFHVAPGTAAPWDPTVLQPASACGLRIDVVCRAGDAIVAYDHTLPNKSFLNNYRGVFTMNINDTPLGDITAITGYKRYEWMDNIDTDGTISAFARGKNFSNGWQLTQEVRSDFELTDSLRGIAGVYAIKDWYETARQGQFGGGFLQQTFQLQKNYSVSGFANLYWDITPQLQVLGGIRYSYEHTRGVAGDRQSLNTTGLDIQPFCGTRCSHWDQTRPPGNTDLGGVGPIEKADSWEQVAWKVGLNFSPTDDILTYASVSSGFKSGGFTLRIGRPEDIGPFDPERVITYEAGIKAEWLDGRLRTNISAFFNDYKDIQLAVPYLFIDSAGVYRNGTAIRNAASAHISGFEFEVVAAPTDQLTIGVSGTVLDANYQRFRVGNLDSAGNPVELNLDGVRLQNAPPLAFTVFGDLEVPVASGTLTLHGDFAYTGEKLQNTDPFPRSYLRATQLANASIAWAPSDQDWSISLWVNNIADTRYYSTAYAAQGVLSLFQYADPRELGLTFRANF
jgi:iron complex outermembrane recepter protein